MIFLKNKTQFEFNHLRTTLKVIAITSQAIALNIAGLSSAHALGEVKWINFEEVKAKPYEYVLGDITYRWGTGVDRKITSFVYDGTTYEYKNLANKVKIRRVNNDLSTGKRCTLFVEKEDNFNYLASYPLKKSKKKGKGKGKNQGNCNMAKVMSGRTINIGALDVFSNQRDDSGKNIERVDFIYTHGITAPKANSLRKTGHVVTEKQGNNYVKIAAILSLDKNKNPASYGPLVLVHPKQACDHFTDICYGITNFGSNNDFVANELHPPQKHVHRIYGSYEPLGMAFVSLEALKVPENSTYYGFSYFGKDTDTSVGHVLTKPSTFPLDTPNNGVLSAGDADMYGGVAGYFVDIACEVDCGDPEPECIEDCDDPDPDCIEDCYISDPDCIEDCDDPDPDCIEDCYVPDPDCIEDCDDPECTEDCAPELSFGNAGRFNFREINFLKITSDDDGGGVYVE